MAEINLSKYGISGTTEIVHNPSYDELFKEETKPEEDGDKRKFLHIDIADFEKNAITEAKAKNMNVFGVTVYIDESCILKAARAFLVFKAIEDFGEYSRD